MASLPASFFACCSHERGGSGGGGCPVLVVFLPEDHETGPHPRATGRSRDRDPGFPGPLALADFHRTPQIFADSPLLLEIQAFGGRRKPQKTADFRRKPKIFAENCSLASVTLGPSPLARPEQVPVKALLLFVSAVLPFPSAKHKVGLELLWGDLQHIIATAGASTMTM